MKERIINPIHGIYPTTPDYIHAIELTAPDRFLFVSGTMGLDQMGAAPDTLSEQLELVWLNIRQILSEAGMTTDNIVRITSYLTDPEDAAENQSARLNAIGDRKVPTTAIVVQTLSAEWKIEIEVVAAA